MKQFEITQLVLLLLHHIKSFSRIFAQLKEIFARAFKFGQFYIILLSEASFSDHEQLVMAIRNSNMKESGRIVQFQNSRPTSQWSVVHVLRRSVEQEIQPNSSARIQSGTARIFDYLKVDFWKIESNRITLWEKTTRKLATVRQKTEHGNRPITTYLEEKVKFSV